jgi:uncharacterized protein involved in exopolysaccharide biosynthesis
MDLNIDKKIDDIVPLLHSIWADRRRLVRNCIIAVVVGLIVAFSIPREYESIVVLAPESSQGGTLSGLSSLASMAGVNVGNLSSEDALYPELYPQMTGSTIFLSDLYSMEVTSSDGEIKTTLFDYIANKQSKPWWEYILALPVRLKEMILPKNGGMASIPEDVSYYSYSEKQHSVINRLRKKVWTSVDLGNNVITIDVMMQDAKIAAQVADRVASLLQEYITKYRTNKSQQDYNYSEKLFKEAEAEYHKKQEEYARYMDKHMLGTLKMQYKAEEERLMNEMQLAYGIYNQMAQQKEIARAKVQERTPVYTVMQPAVIPFLPAGPRKLFILVGFLFLTVFGHISWLIVGDKLKSAVRKIAEK